MEPVHLSGHTCSRVSIQEVFHLSNSDLVPATGPFPQIFIKGEFIGGSYIILNMHQTGKLKEMIKDITANQERSE
ncbi:monothiol glutaredoxin-S15, mitochondrial-like isoform X2 [Camellia sinensis]|uniref:monothiol glutaredoxin-S15, mitochondrial-like isoform X2 n=1 Tax=Camellia sinensis TaxID=4442 RepID=UPI001036175E|nr:monothiol glutaredoxin-S15, mitochondrial-like isoform X2 [Camellia sinensis]XP_028066940.1 monothiol glutaredoxin-S15, mitochondrial-like isoform X2 [Camellia sinensis]